MLGLKDDKPKEKKTEKKPAEKSQDVEAKKILQQMEAKKDAGDCPFCQSNETPQAGFSSLGKPRCSSWIKIKVT